MSKSVLSEVHFHSEEAAVAFVEAWLWPTGPVCPFCDATAERIGSLAGVRSKRSKKNPAGKVILGLRKCYACRKQFTVRVGTVLESSHAPLHIWLQAIYLLCSSKKGISTRQLQRTLKCGMKTAWFLGMRIREAMAPAANAEPLGGMGAIVEADETELALSKKSRPRPRSENKKFISLVERGGRVRSKPFTGMGVIGIEVRKIMRENVHAGSIAHTDGAGWYRFGCGPLAGHEAVDHNKTYVRHTPEGVKVHTNSAEGYFSIFKRGLVGTYQHMSERHLHRYLAEFDFRMSNRIRLGIDDEMRTVNALKGAAGKRLTYRTPDSQTA
jgi:transposase-like protein